MDSIITKTRRGYKVEPNMNDDFTSNAVKVLIVEDEKIVALDLARKLKSLDYEIVDMISTGEQAYSTVEKKQPDLILMDIRLKGEMDGIEAAESIRAEFDVPVIYMTAYADEYTLQRAKITEPYGYILKPYEEKTLHTTIEMALYKHNIEKKLYESERWLSATLKSIGDGIIATDKNGKVKMMNHVAETLTGRAQKEAIGNNLDEIFVIIDERTREEVENPVNKVFNNEKVINMVQTILMNKRGEEIPIVSTASPIINEKQEIEGVVLVFQDISERKKAEKERERLLKM